MVSDFLCTCHRPLNLSDKQLQENSHVKDKNAYILRSIQVDGYWTSKHMMEQVWLIFFYVCIINEKIFLN